MGDIASTFFNKIPLKTIIKLGNWFSTWGSGRSIGSQINFHGLPGCVGKKSNKTRYFVSVILGLFVSNSVHHPGFFRPSLFPTMFLSVRSLLQKQKKAWIQNRRKKQKFFCRAVSAPRSALSEGKSPQGAVGSEAAVENSLLSPPVKVLLNILQISAVHRAGVYPGLMALNPFGRHGT